MFVSLGCLQAGCVRELAGVGAAPGDRQWSSWWWVRCYTLGSSAPNSCLCVGVEGMGIPFSVIYKTQSFHQVNLAQARYFTLKVLVYLRSENALHCSPRWWHRYLSLMSHVGVTRDWHSIGEGQTLWKLALSETWSDIMSCFICRVAKKFWAYVHWTVCMY